jgi:hypothetical protein
MLTKFKNPFQYFVCLRAPGNPDHQQYADIAPLEVHIVSSLDEAVTYCKGYIKKWDLGVGNWGSDRADSELRSGNVFDLDGNLKYRISWGGGIKEASGHQWKNLQWSVQFRSWNKWQVSRLESCLEPVATYIVTEDWTGCEENPAVITFCQIHNQSINQILAIAHQASPYIHLGYIGI